MPSQIVSQLSRASFWLKEIVYMIAERRGDFTAAERRAIYRHCAQIRNTLSMIDGHAPAE